MRYATLIITTFLTLSSGVALAQSRPQLTWQGYVTGSATLYVQGDRVDAQGRDTGSVESPRVTLNDALPAVRQTVQLDVRRGRGRVNIVEQPTPRNEYSAVVRIDPVGTRPELYTIDFFWNPTSDTSDDRRYRQNRRNDQDESRRNDRYGNRRTDDYGYRNTRNRTNDANSSGEMTWNGFVDNQVLVEVRGRRASTRVLRGTPVRNAQSDFTGPLPRRTASTVRIERLSGRGNIELLEQPDANNSYAAVVRITDTEAGADNYAFRLFWDGDGYGYDDRNSNIGSYGTNNSGGILTPGGSSYGTQGAMRWSARVDGRVRVHVSNNRAWTTRVSGGALLNEQVDFNGSAIPRVDFNDIQVRKIDGRGDVRILQQPNSSNGYTLVFEIDDNEGGADNYSVEVSWML